MAYRALGQAAACPLPPQPPPRPDPCERTYVFDIPIWGRSNIKVPLTQMVDDAYLQMRGYIPMFYKQIEPMITDERHKLMADMEFELPYIFDGIMNEQILPAVEKQKENVIAQAEVLRDEALKVGLAMTAAIVLAIGMGAYWITTRR